MKTIFVVHVEDMFRSSYPPGYLEALAEYLEEQAQHARIIGLVSEVQDMHHCEEVRWFENQEWSWSWGYEPDMFIDSVGSDEAQWCIESNGHEWTYVPSEIRNGGRPRGEVEVVGGYSVECLADWVSVLDHLNIPHQVNWDHVY